MSSYGSATDDWDKVKETVKRILKEHVALNDVTINGEYLNPRRIEADQYSSVVEEKIAETIEQLPEKSIAIESSHDSSNSQIMLDVWVRKIDDIDGVDKN